MDTFENGAIIETFSNGNGDGRVYPDTFQVRQTPYGFEVWDCTGWTGHETCDPFMIASFPTDTEHTYPALARDMAVNRAWSLSVFSDTRKVFEAAVDLVNKRQGSFAALKEAIDWRDK